MRPCIAITILMSLCHLPAFGQAGPGVKTEIQRSLDEFVRQEQIPGATLAIVSQDGSAISLAAGFADPKAELPMKPGARMLVGSTGKTFVSAVALQLVEQRKLNLDSKVSSWFQDERDREWFRRLPNSDSMTVRSLMTHTSGLPRYIFQRAFLTDLRDAPLKVRTPRECLSVLLDMKAQHDVGQGWHYSDTNYLLLGLIIEKATGSSYYDELRRRLLRPLALSNTLPSTSPNLPGLTLGHMAERNVFGLPTTTLRNGRYVLNPGFEWCGGGLMSNSNDLAKWMHALHSNKVLKPETHNLLVQTSRPPARLPDGALYGLGCMVWKTDRGDFYGHSGMMPGYLTQIEFSARDRFAVALQINTDVKVAGRMHGFVQSVSRRFVASLHRLE